MARGALRPRRLLPRGRPARRATSRRRPTGRSAPSSPRPSAGSPTVRAPLHVVDVGCGRGELLAHLHAARPDLRLTGVDVVARPPGLPDAVAWLTSDGGAALPGALTDLDDVLVVAHEWLDVVPCTVARVVAPGRLAVVLVDPETGEESTGPEPTPDELAWCARYWPVDDLPVGARVEVGVARDAAWDDLGSRVRRGHAARRGLRPHARRPPDGRHADGLPRGERRSAPVPDGSCDLTAHVAVDALAHDERTTQRAALLDLGTSRRPSRPHPGAHRPRRLPRGAGPLLGRGGPARPGRARRLPVGAAAGSPEVTCGAPAWHRGVGAAPGCRPPPSRSPCSRARGWSPAAAPTRRPRSSSP